VIARRHLHLLIALLLPLMVMRGMLPAGYMPVAEDGVFRMALCSDGLQQPGQSDPDKHQLPGSSGDCLFAHAAAAPPPSIIAVAAPEFVGAQSTEVSAAQQTANVIPRAQSPRGPPALQ
jgi:hypothetical protein